MKSASEYLQLLRSLLPWGRAWNREEDSGLTEFLHAEADEFSRVDERSDDLLQERDTRYTSELLTDHELDLGLPDDCTQLGETIQERRSIAHTQLITLGGQDKGYFIDLAAALGFTITITEYTPFWCGLGGCGDEGGDQDNIFYWNVTIDVASVPDIYFLCGSSECGDSLMKASVYDGLMCRLNALKPAHTQLVFTFGGPEFDMAFDRSFDSLSSETADYSEGAFAVGFGLGYDICAAGGYDAGAFTDAFRKPAYFGYDTDVSEDLEGAFTKAFGDGFNICQTGEFEGFAFGDAFKKELYFQAHAERCFHRSFGDGFSTKYLLTPH